MSYQIEISNADNLLRIVRALQKEEIIESRALALNLVEQSIVQKEGAVQKEEGMEVHPIEDG